MGKSANFLQVTYLAHHVSLSAHLLRPLPVPLLGDPPAEGELSPHGRFKQCLKQCFSKFCTGTVMKSITKSETMFST